MSHSLSPRAAAFIARGRVKIDVTAAADAKEPRSERLIAFWREAAAPPALLRRAQLPARAILDLMSFIIVLEPADAGASDWRIRLFGMHLQELFKADATNALFSQIYEGSQLADQVGIYRQIAAGQAPHVTRGYLRGTDAGNTPLEIVHLPIEGREAGSRWLLIALFFTNNV